MVSQPLRWLPKKKEKKEIGPLRERFIRVPCNTTTSSYLSFSLSFITQESLVSLTLSQSLSVLFQSLKPKGKKEGEVAGGSSWARKCFIFQQLLCLWWPYCWFPWCYCSHRGFLFFFWVHCNDYYPVVCMCVLSLSWSWWPSLLIPMVLMFVWLTFNWDVENELFYFILG